MNCFCCVRVQPKTQQLLGGKPPVPVCTTVVGYRPQFSGLSSTRRVVCDGPLNCRVDPSSPLFSTLLGPLHYISVHCTATDPSVKNKHDAAAGVPCDPLLVARGGALVPIRGADGRELRRRRFYHNNIHGRQHIGRKYAENKQHINTSPRIRLPAASPTREGYHGGGVGERRERSWVQHGARAAGCEQ